MLRYFSYNMKSCITIFVISTAWFVFFWVSCFGLHWWCCNDFKPYIVTLILPVARAYQQGQFFFYLDIFFILRFLDSALVLKKPLLGKDLKSETPPCHPILKFLQLDGEIFSCNRCWVGAGSWSMLMLADIAVHEVIYISLGNFWTSPHHHHDYHGYPA